jgi:purine catabolism regulator
MDLEDRRLWVLVLDVPGISGQPVARRLSEHDKQSVRAKALSVLRGAAERVNAVVLAGTDGDGLVAVVGLPQGGEFGRALEALATETVEGIAASEGVETVVGISRETSVDSLTRAFEEARDASHFASQMRRRPGIQRYDELGLHQLLLPMSSRPELARFVEAELGPLLAHDAKCASTLLPTLRVYLARSGNKAEATRELHVERRTLYRRVERIERLLGRSISGHESRTRLAIALYGLDLLREKTLPQALAS